MSVHVIVANWLAALLGKTRGASLTGLDCNSFNSHDLELDLVTLLLEIDPRYGEDLSTCTKYSFLGQGNIKVILLWNTHIMAESITCFTIVEGDE